MTADHAILILKVVLEYGELRLYPYPVKKTKIVSTDLYNYFAALIDGTKAILDSTVPGWESSNTIPVWNRQKMQVLIDFANAIEPRIKDAGIEVPK